MPYVASLSSVVVFRREGGAFGGVSSQISSDAGFRLSDELSEEDPRVAAGLCGFHSLAAPLQDQGVAVARPPA